MFLIIFADRYLLSTAIHSMFPHTRQLGNALFLSIRPVQRLFSKSPCNFLIHASLQANNLTALNFI